MLEMIGGKKVLIVTAVMAALLPPALSYAWWDDHRGYPYHRYYYEEPYYVPVETRYVVVEQPQVVEVVPAEPNQTKVAEGSVMGGLLGALAGGIIGHQMKGHHELGGALLGGVAGATIGGVAGAQIPSDHATTVRPQAAISPVPVAAEAFTVSVPNSQSGYTQVVIRRSGNGFIGPQGEFYSEFPKIEQLRVMYGK
ncbi:MAG: glycine zipper 2TM domain-containing protein [Candidatus Omnitrophota bacterium]